MPSKTDSHSPADPEPPDPPCASDIQDGKAIAARLAAFANVREDIEDAPFWREVEAFNRMPQHLVDEYYGQYIAVYNGNIVDADPDEGELALRFYRIFGYVPVYIHKVGTEEGLVDTDDL